METDETPKKRKHRSWLWDHFKESSKDNAECLICEDLISIKHGTNTMKNHLSRKHDLNNPSEEVQKKGKPIFGASDAANRKLYVSSSY